MTTTARVIFVDTSAFAAIENRHDNLHPAALELRRKVLTEGVKFATTDYVIDETITLLLKRAGHSVATEFGSALLASRVIEIHRITSDRFLSAWRLFSGHKDKAFSFTDCTSFALMKELGIIEAFTFDRHFEQAGFRVTASPRSR